MNQRLDSRCFGWQRLHSVCCCYHEGCACICPPCTPLKGRPVWPRKESRTSYSQIHKNKTTKIWSFYFLMSCCVFNKEMKNEIHCNKVHKVRKFGKKLYRLRKEEQYHRALFNNIQLVFERKYVTTRHLLTRKITIWAVDNGESFR